MELNLVGLLVAFLFHLLKGTGQLFLRPLSFSLSSLVWNAVRTRDDHFRRYFPSVVRQWD